MSIRQTRRKTNNRETSLWKDKFLKQLDAKLNLPLSCVKIESHPISCKEELKYRRKKLIEYKKQLKELEKAWSQGLIDMEELSDLLVIVKQYSEQTRKVKVTVQL